MKQKVFIFAALPYANGPLHLGHIAGAYLPYDAFRRFMKLRGFDVVTSSGSDEHGTPITIKSIRENIQPGEIARRFHEVNVGIFKKMGIEFDSYIETSEALHKEVVTNFLRELMEKGYIYEDTMTQPFCAKEGIFLADRYVRGKCPVCGYELATGDQCENCGTTLEPIDLINPVCIFDQSSPEFRDTKHLFFRLSKLQPELLDYLKTKEYWRPNVLQYTRNFIKGGLKDRPITRDLNWGVRVPFEGYDEKRVYVWFEALLGYLTGIAKLEGGYERATQIWGDLKIRHYYFMGKDNIAFHSIIWPAMLLAYGNLALPYFVAANEYLNFKGEKFSKSRGTDITMPAVLDKYNVDFVRFGLFYNLPEEHDSDFTIEEFQSRVNSELIDKFGNFVNRALVLSFKRGAVTADQIAQNELDVEAERKMRDAVSSIITDMERVSIRNAFKTWLELAHYGNSYITQRKPWEQCKRDDANCNAAIYTGVKLVFILALAAQIFLPETSKKILNWLGYDQPVAITEDVIFPVAKVATIPDKLYEKLTEVEIPLSLKVARITDVRDHANAEKLYILDLDVGTENRRIVSGIRDDYTKDSLVGKKIVILCNLKPATIRGEQSNGMLLAAEDEAGVHLVLAPAVSQEGDEVRIGNVQTNPREITIEEFRKINLRTAKYGGDLVPALIFESRTYPLEVKGGFLKIDGEVKEGIKVK